MNTDAGMDTQVKNVRAVAWALNRAQVVVGNPNATRDDVAAAWRQNKSDLIILGRKILSSLQQQGFILTAPEGEVEAQKE